MKSPKKVSGLLGGASQGVDGGNALVRRVSPPPHLIQQFGASNGALDAGGETELPQMVDLGLIEPSPRQNRLPVSAARVEALANDITRHGLNNPVIVRPIPGGRYELVVGETRVAAYKLNGETAIPAFVRPMGDNDAARRLVLDNFHHGDLSDYEIYKGLSILKEILVEEGRQGSLSEIAELTPWTKTQVFRLMSFAKLPAEALFSLEKGGGVMFGAQAASDLGRIADELGEGGHGTIADAVRAVLAGELEQGRAVDWVKERFVRMKSSEGQPQPQAKPKRTVRAVTVADGRLACTIEKTPRGFVVKGAKGVALEKLEEELVAWLTAKLEALAS